MHLPLHLLIVLYLLLHTHPKWINDSFYKVKIEDNEVYSVFVDIPKKFNYQKEANIGASNILKREKAFME